MASTAALELLVRLNGANEAGRELDNLGKKGGGLGDVFKGSLAVAGGAILGLGAGLAYAATQAAEEEVGIARLNNTLKNTIPNWDGNTDAVEAYIAKQEQLAFADDELRDSLNQLVAQTGNLAEAQELQATAMDLARSKGMDLQTATKLVGKVDADNIGILARYGIMIDKNATKEEALAAIRAVSAGQAETYANTTAGAMERIQNTLGNVVEDIGGAVLGLVDGPLQAFADWFQSPEVQAAIQTIAAFIGDTLAGAFQILQNVIGFVMPIIQPFVDAIVGFFSAIQGGGDFMTALSGYFNDLGAAISNAWAIISPALGELLGNIVQWIVDNGPTILATLAGWAVNFATWVWNDAIPALLEALGGLLSGLFTWITDNGPGILAQLGVWATQFWQWIVDVTPTVLSALGTFVSGIWNWIVAEGPGILAQLGTWAAQFWQWIVDVTPTVLSTLGTLISTIWNWIITEGPGILLKLGEWALAFIGWILPMIPPFLLELGKIAVSILGWIGQTALDLGTKIVTEWIPGLWNWITGPGGVIEVLPGKLGEIAGEIWFWVSETARFLWTKLVNEWIPAFWLWITGENGILKKIGTKLAEIWTAITSWIGDIANKIGTEVAKVGENMASGIGKGFQDLWDGSVEWGILNNLFGVVPKMNDAVGAKSPARALMPVGENMAAGIGAGFEQTWPSIIADITGQVKAAVIDLADVINGISWVANPLTEWGQSGVIGPPSAIGGGFGRGAVGAGGGGGLSIGTVIVHAGAGADGRQFAGDFIEGIEYQLGLSIATRRPDIRVIQ